MKQLLRVLSLILALVLALGVLVACDDEPAPTPDNGDTGDSGNNGDGNNDSNDGQTPVIYSLELDADKFQVIAGGEVTLRATLKSASGETEITDAVYTIVEGGDIATVTGNKITVSATAEDGAVIKVKTTKDGINSNVVSIVVIPDTTVDSIEIFAHGATEEVTKGSIVVLGATITPANVAESFLLWTVTEGADIAKIQGTALIVGDNAAVGDTIKVKASFGTVSSEELTLTVVKAKQEINSLEVEADKFQVIAGGEVTLNTVLKSAEGETEITDAVYTIVEGSDIATVAGNKITIGANAEDGAIIKVKTTKDGIDSNVVSIVVIPDTTVDSIEIFVHGSTSVMKGSTVALGATITPANVEASLLLWTVTEGNDIAEVQGTALIVDSKAQTGAIIKVKASFGNITSEELTLTVVATNEEINATKYLIDSPTNSLTIDKKGAATMPLTIEVRNYNFELVEDLPVRFEVLTGAEYLGITQDGYSCAFTAKGHGKATLNISIDGTNVTETVDVDVIVPPESIALPEVFVERPMAYAFSMKDALPFLPIPKGEGACTDLSFDFIHESGATGSDVAEYEDGKLVFKMTGKVAVYVNSASGSRTEAKATYTFDINNGYNVHTYEELEALVESNSYRGDAPINFVVLEKPVGIGEGYTYEYGYDLVPAVALKPMAEQTVNDVLADPVRVQAVNKGLWINGNNHRIDASQMKIYTEAEMLAYLAEKHIAVTNENKSIYGSVSSLLSAEPYSSLGAGKDPNVEGKTYSVKLYNIDIKGNCPIDYDPGDYNGGVKTSGIVGATSIGISIGGNTYDVDYYIDANNLTASQFRGGINLDNIVGNGKISNVYTYNCYSTGIFVHSSIVTFENLTFGPCGATGIELSPDLSDKSGVDNNENQKVTIVGTVKASYLNDGETTYFQNYVIGSATVPQIITGNTQMYPESMISHIRNTDGQFIFIALKFKDFTTFAENHSDIVYPPYMEGGIIDLADLPTDGSVDTTHQFIRMTIYVDIPGAGRQDAGTALFYNMNYGK